jgi:hypothetical protein
MYLRALPIPRHRKSHRQTKTRGKKIIFASPKLRTILYAYLSWTEEDRAEKPFLFFKNINKKIKRKGDLQCHVTLAPDTCVFVIATIKLLFRP